MFFLLSLCFPSPQNNLQNLFQMKSDPPIWNWFHDSEQLWYFKHLLAVVYGAIADNLQITLWHHMLVADGQTPTTEDSGETGTSNVLMKLSEECRE